MTWSDLKLLATGYIHRKDLNYDDYQATAISDMALRLDILENETFAKITAVHESAVDMVAAPLPVDYGRLKAAKQAGQVLQTTDIANMMFDHQDVGFCAVSNRKLYVSAEGDITILYGAKWPALADAETNIILDTYPQIYLYAVLVQAATYIQDFDALGVYGGQLESYIGVANANKAMAQYTSLMAPGGGAR